MDEAGGIIAVGSEDGGLYAYNALTGENLHWSPFRTDGKVWSTPVLRNGVAYFGSQDGAVYAVSLETGALVWRFDTGGAVVAAPLVHKNLLIVGSFDRKLYALGLNDGQPRWQIEAENWWWATPVSSGRAIYAPSMDGNVYAVDDNGVLLWKYDMGAPIVADPVLVERGIVVASREGRVVLLRASASAQETPQEMASYSIRDGEIKAPLVKTRNRRSGRRHRAGSGVRRHRRRQGAAAASAFRVYAPLVLRHGQQHAMSPQLGTPSCWPDGDRQE